MEQWRCFKCNEGVVEADITTTYLEIIRFIKGLKCPKCGKSYMTEKIALEVINKGEEEIEAKLG